MAIKASIKYIIYGEEGNDIDSVERDDDHRHLDAKVFNFQLSESPVAGPPLKQHCHLRLSDMTLTLYMNIYNALQCNILQ